MGIKGLNKLIQQFAESSVTTANIADFKNSIIAIDSEILVHRYRSELKNSHIYGFVNNVIFYLSNGIVPVYVFDGIPTAAKQEHVLQKRQYIREQIYNKATELEIKLEEQLDQLDDFDQFDQFEVLSPEINNTMDQLNKIKRKITYLTVGKNYRNECKYLLKLLGIPFVVANDDAEAYCAALYNNGLVDYVCTEDTDIIPYIIGGCDVSQSKVRSRPMKVLHNYNIGNMITVIDVHDVVNKFEMTSASFVDMCILSGCDYCSTVPKFGHLKAHTYITKYKSIEAVISALSASPTGITIPDKFNYDEARSIFLKKHTIVEDVDVGVTLKGMCEQELEKYLNEERGIDATNVINKIRGAYTAFYELRNTEKDCVSISGNNCSGSGQVKTPKIVEDSWDS